jgi:hypothetical protein
MAHQGYVSGLFSLLLRIFSLGSFVIGIGFIAFGCVLESPPKTFVPGCGDLFPLYRLVIAGSVTCRGLLAASKPDTWHTTHCERECMQGMHTLTKYLYACRACVAIGVFAILSSAVGYAGSHFKPFFLMLYLIVGTVSTTLQLLIVSGIFGAQDRVADEIVAADSASGIQHFSRCAAATSCHCVHHMHPSRCAAEISRQQQSARQCHLSSPNAIPCPRMPVDNYSDHA